MACAGAAEEAILADPVDNALSPAVNPVLALIGRTPVVADALAAVIGTGTPLVRIMSHRVSHRFY